MKLLDEKNIVIAISDWKLSSYKIRLSITFIHLKKLAVDGTLNYIFIANVIDGIRNNLFTLSTGKKPTLF